MAVAARPATSDARVPCPLCGGLLHPIAGRCKHCKADLTGYQSARPAASTPLPSLHGAVYAAAPVAPASASPAGPMIAREAAQPVLPPRPARAYPVEPKTAAWRSWPVLVILVAVLAIAGALAAMAWPASAARPDGKRSLPPPPAPERMQTDPQVKPPPRTVPRSAQPDLAPPAQSAPPARGAAIDPDDSTDSDDGHDLDATDDALGGPSPAARNPVQGGGAIRFAMMSRVCLKLARCGGSDDIGVQGMCEALAAQAIEPPTCPAAQRCLARIDTLPCDVQPNVLMHIQMLVIRLPDCADAARC